MVVHGHETLDSDIAAVVEYLVAASRADVLEMPGCDAHLVVKRATPDAGHLRTADGGGQCAYDDAGAGMVEERILARHHVVRTAALELALEEIVLVRGNGSRAGLGELCDATLGKLRIGDLLYGRIACRRQPMRHGVGQDAEDHPARRPPLRQARSRRVHQDARPGNGHRGLRHAVEGTHRRHKRRAHHCMPALHDDLAVVRPYAGTNDKTPHERRDLVEAGEAVACRI